MGVMGYQCERAPPRDSRLFDFALSIQPVMRRVLQMILLLLFLAIAPFVYYRYVNRIKGLPPGPAPLPFIGNVLTAASEKPDDLMIKLSKTYGDVFTLWLPEPTVVVTGHKLLNETVAKSGEAMAFRPTQFLMTQIYQGKFGLFFNENSFYKSQRRFAVHTLSNIGVGKAEITDLIVEMASRMCEDLEATNGKVIELKPMVTKPVGNVIQHLIFGKMSDSEDEELAWFQQRNIQVFEDFMDPKMLILDSFPFLAKFDKYLNLGLERNLKANDEMTAFLYKKIDQNKKNIDYDEEPTNYVDAFLQEMKRRGEGELTDEFNEHQLAMSIFDLYSAGMETIVITLRACALFMLNHPEVKEKLFEEVDRVVGRDSAPVFAEQHKLPYVSAFLQEVYRICYVLELGVFRMTSKETQLGNYMLPAETRVLPQFPAVHMNEKHFPEAEKLIPERHLKDGVFIKDEKVTPFSVGRRNCLGENLARQEVFVFLVSLLQKFDFLPEKDTPPPVNIVTKAFRSPAPFKLRVVPRA